VNEIYSLIIPVLDRLEELKLLYNSIKSTYPIKILLIDNGSGKETLKYISKISKDPRVIVTFDGFNKGASYARNKGLDFAFKTLKSKGVFFIDSDVVLGEGCLDELISFQKKTKAALVFPYDQKVEGFTFEQFAGKGFAPSFKTKTLFGTGCCFIPFSTFDKVGYFDEMFFPVYFEDMDYFYRIKLEVGELLLCPGAFGFHFGSQTIGKSDDFSKYKKQRFGWLMDYYRNKWGGLPGKEKFKKSFNSDKFTPLPYLLAHLQGQKDRQPSVG